MIHRITSIEQIPDVSLNHLGNSFALEGKIPGGFDLEHFKSTWKVLLATDMGSMWVLEKDGRMIGGIGGILYNTMFSPRLVAVETFWYVDIQERGSWGGVRLHHAFEAWAVMKKARDIIMVRIHDIMPQALVTYYEKHGYRAFETCYIRSI